MRMNLVEEIERVVEERPAMRRLLTLTLDPEKAPGGNHYPGDDDCTCDHCYITRRWNALRTRLKREVGDFSYIWVREEQDNGNPHIHAIVSRYLPQAVVSKAWADLGGGEVVDLRRIDRVEKVAHYVGKYLTKDSLTDFGSGVHRYGSSADIELAVRGDESDEESEEWSLMMDDYLMRGEPLRRAVTDSDFAQQRAWQGPVG
jgi:hypothetical protein